MGCSLHPMISDGPCVMWILQNSLASSSPNRKCLKYCRRNWTDHEKNLTPILCFRSVHLSCSLLISEIDKGHVILRAKGMLAFPPRTLSLNFCQVRTQNPRVKTRFSMNRIQRSVQSSAQTQQQRQPRRSFCNISVIQNLGRGTADLWQV